eukprot:3048387-Rhodomonas_salina.1
MPFLSNKKKSLLPAMRIKLPIASKKDLVLKEHNNPTSRNNLGQCSSKLICHENAKIQLTCGKENEFPTTLSAQFEWQSKTKSESFPIMQQTGHQHEDESNSVIKGALPRGVVCDSAWNPKQPPLEPPAHTAKHFDIVKPGDEHIFMTERTEGFLSRQKSKLQSARPSLPVSFREARASFREARAKASLKTKTTRSVHPEPFSISPAAGIGVTCGVYAARLWVRSDTSELNTNVASYLVHPSTCRHLPHSPPRASPPSQTEPSFPPLCAQDSAPDDVNSQNEQGRREEEIEEEGSRRMETMEHRGRLKNLTDMLSKKLRGRSHGSELARYTDDDDDDADGGEEEDEACKDEMSGGDGRRGPWVVASSQVEAWQRRLRRWSLEPSVAELKRRLSIDPAHSLGAVFSARAPEPSAEHSPTAAFRSLPSVVTWAVQSAARDAHVSSSPLRPSHALARELKSGATKLKRGSGPEEGKAGAW